ncbi:hypothetical protein A5747_13580 [Mycobacterium sp. IS-836]|uniref:hypothetical protein n=1 Tax=Mycobacterium sp. IS-836 TaxID=1834160 RepID=UPI00096EBFAF|nr:hypothetical protein [Mycobacterium sp. IS-836]OMC55416.1 hypothetical protein A5747_13580 [Mycobacterium sp. IS-836]
MSHKVAVESAKPKWRDAVTIGDLVKMVNALMALGHDYSTPVTYIYDEDHVWLETVDDDDFAQSLVCAAAELVPFDDLSDVIDEVHDYVHEEDGPREVQELGLNERDAHWVDTLGDEYHWDAANRWWVRTEPDGDVWEDTGCWEGYGPYREIPPPTRDQLTAADRDYDWDDEDGDRWHWLEDDRGAGYALLLEDGNYSSGRNKVVSGWCGPYKRVPRQS